MLILILNFDWNKVFANCRSNEQVGLLTNAIMNIVSKSVTNENILSNDRDNLAPGAVQKKKKKGKRCAGDEVLRQIYLE